jgi:hypothetical protein
VIRDRLRIVLHPHAIERAEERGATEAEIVDTIRTGERFPAKRGRSAFRRNVAVETVWRGRRYANKQIEVIAVEEDEAWLVITVLVKFY